MQESLVRQYAALSGCPRAANVIGRGVFGWAHVAPLLMLMCTVGCAGEKLKSIKGMEQFQREVLESPQPVLLAFYKGGCATCVPLDPVLEKLDEEYKGRAVVAKCMLMTLFFYNTCPELRERYDISFYPTVLLFVDGEEKKRWIIHYNIDNYRKQLDHWLAPTTQATSQAATQATTRAATRAATQAARLVVTQVSSRPASAPAPRVPASAAQGGPSSGP